MGLDPELPVSLLMERTGTVSPRDLSHPAIISNPEVGHSDTDRLAPAYLAQEEEDGTDVEGETHQLN